jgi:hypothetical protein
VRVTSGSEITAQSGSKGELLPGSLPYAITPARSVGESPSTAALPPPPIAAGRRRPPGAVLHPHRKDTPLPAEASGDLAQR